MTELKTESKILVSLRAALFCFLASSLAAIISLYIQNWFGVYDLEAFYYFTAPFIVLTAITAPILNRLTGKRRPFIRYSICSFIGLVLGYGWTMLIALYLGSWFNAFSLPVGLCWMFGGLLGLISAAGFTRPDRF